MKPLVSIIMGSTSDLPVMKKAADFLDSMEIPFEMNALSAHRTPAEVEEFARTASERGLKVIIAAAGMAAALPGVIAASTTLPVIGVPLDATLGGKDAMLSIIQMPPGIAVATVGINASMNAAVLATQMIALTDADVAARFAAYRAGLKEKIVKANAELAKIEYKFKTN
ncbi:MAG: 5-(carboxyamino)imidazole ribonucleotide mutase [Bacteroidales bacterium]|nr:5-(carboxyamino)imidazole ribonucleotide mutase [Bacteroidales bacterium]MBD5235015.1 5-(carboxyamino)imidazole ribonucleotide mutase [Barnesiella sp.]MBD5257577.1 5-(carboxyamino)imidazole ribonucleotide mutase [Barnesiella sp.]MDE6317662.1 5-(carboxyamino)imidazole ribonucleotide mutase [Muribaculaceae bacterium]